MKIKASSIWKVLNQPVCVLIISSLIVTGLGRLYTDYVTHEAAKKTLLDELTELRTEIEFRATELRGLTSVTFSSNSLDDYTKNAIVRSAECASDQDNTGVPKFKIGPQEHKAIESIFAGTLPYSPAIAKYANINLVGLMFRLDQIYPTPRSGKRAKKLPGAKLPKGLGNNEDQQEPWRIYAEVESLKYQTDECSVIDHANYLDRYLNARDPEALVENAAE